MGNFIAALIIIVFFGLLILGAKETHKENKATAAMINSGHYHAEYLGGSPHIDAATIGYIKPRENGFAFTGNRTHLTKWANIKSVEVKNHEQITQDITAGRVLLLGVFALAAKKQTVHTKQYLVIHCEEEEVNYDMVFTGVNMGALASQINKALIGYRKETKALS
jgi:hypothetical protein